MANMNNLITDIVKALRSSEDKKTSAYDTQAKVVRIEGDTAWVHIPGGVDETPIKRTIDAKEGDTVQVRVSGGSAWIVGNESAPPTDDTTANYAYSTANYAYGTARAAQETADDASAAAQTAWNYADTAKDAADSAQASADSAQASAVTANNAANNALTQLSVVEDVAGTLDWISEHGSYVATTDTTVNADKIYFVYQNGDYVPIVNPDPTANPQSEGWYVLDVSDSQAEYIMAHLAVTSAGLWVLPVNGLAEHPLVDSDDNQLVDSDSNYVVDWSMDPQNASGYKVLLSGTGMTVYDGSGAAVAVYSDTTTIGEATGNNVYIDNNSVDIRDGSTVLASFGTKVVLGKEGNNYRLELESNAMDYKHGSTSIFKVSTDAVLNWSSATIDLPVGYIISDEGALYLGIASAASQIRLDDNDASIDFYPGDKIKIEDHAPFVTKTATSSTISSVAAGAGSGEDITFTVPTGYTPVAVKTIQSSSMANVMIGGWYFSSNDTVRVGYRNCSSSAVSNVTFTAVVLFARDELL